MDWFNSNKQAKMFPEYYGYCETGLSNFDKMCHSYENVL